MDSEQLVANIAVWTLLIAIPVAVIFGRKQRRRK